MTLPESGFSLQRKIAKMSMHSEPFRKKNTCIFLSRFLTSLCLLPVIRAFNVESVARNQTAIRLFCMIVATGGRMLPSRRGEATAFPSRAIHTNDVAPRSARAEGGRVFVKIRASTDLLF